MQCTKCKYPDSHVVKSIYNPTRSVVTRRRECLRCGNRWSTEEQLRDRQRIDDRYHTGNMAK